MTFHFWSCSSTMSKTHAHPIAGSVGNVLEWYDFAVFGFLAPVIGPLFFPESDPVAGLIKTYGVFAAGYLMRPLGGILFGYIGDRLGRRRSLQLSIALMAVPTVLVGCLPTHASVGALATLLLIGLRLLQGLSVGGELIGSITYLVETARPGRRGLTGSFSLVGAIFGILLGSLTVSLIESVLDEAGFVSWGWRIPFLLGMVIFLLGGWLRRSLDESPEFHPAGRAERSPLLAVLRDHPRTVLHTAAMLLLYAASFYTLFVWMPTYLTDFVKPPVEHAMDINTITMVILLGVLVGAGWLADRVGPRRVLIAGCVLLGLLVYPMFRVLDHGVWQEALLMQAVFAVLVGLIQGPVPLILVEAFPASLRNTAIGLSYNITLALFGGTAPMVCTWLIARTNDLAAPAIYLAVLSVISVFALLTLGRAPVRIDR